MLEVQYIDLILLLYFRTKYEIVDSYKFTKENMIDLKKEYMTHGQWDTTAKAQQQATINRSTDQTSLGEIEL